MAQMISDRRDVDFVLHEQMQVEQLTQCSRFRDFNRNTVDMIVTEARNLAIKEILPTNVLGDQEGCRLESGQVHVPQSFHRAFKLYCDGEWITTIDDPEVGGQGMPVTIAMAAGEYFNGANCAFCMYPALCHGAGKLVELFGTAAQQALYLKKMYTGQWGGSMLLTEPQAGSDVGALTTSAVKNADGTYQISGSKIFITGGDQDLTENIIHPVLARIDGAPAGTKGVSLFLVPKIWVNDDGSLGKPNDVVCTGIEHKLGIRGSSTCSLTLGGNGQCRGVLLGEENKGMRAMFHMMNEARLGVGMQGFAMGSAAYLHALDYARQRTQGRHLAQMADARAPSVPIIEHPDVRRQLLHMKAYVDGMRSFIYYVGLCFDRAGIAETDSDKDRWQGLVEVLTPVVKAYCTDRAFEICTQAVQVFGGYGYICDFPVEQLLRDCKITSIYEGTNGIQAMDLLGRKLGMKQGQYFMALLGEIKQTAAAARNTADLEKMAAAVDKAADQLGQTAMGLGQAAMTAQALDAFALAHPFLDVTGDVVMAWMHLWRAQVAASALAAGAKKKDQPFYQGVLRTAEYMIDILLPATMGKMKAIGAIPKSIMAMSEKGFGGK